MAEEDIDSKIEEIKLKILGSLSKVVDNFEIDNKISLSSLLGSSSQISNQVADSFNEVKLNILDAVKRNTDDGKLKRLKLDREMELSELLGESDKTSAEVVKGFVDVKLNILNAVESQTDGGKLNNLQIDKRISLSELLGETTEDSLLYFFRYRKIKNNILTKIEEETDGGNLGNLKIEKEMRLSDLLGEAPKNYFLFSLKWQKLKSRILDQIIQETDGGKLEGLNIDKDITLSSLLGASPDTDLISKFRFLKIKSLILGKLKKSAKEFEPNLSTSSFMGGSAPPAEGVQQQAQGGVALPVPVASGGGNDLAVLENAREERDIFKDMRSFLETIAKNTGGLEDLSAMGSSEEKQKGFIASALSGVGESLKDRLKGGVLSRFKKSRLGRSKLGSKLFSSKKAVGAKSKSSMVPSLKGGKKTGGVMGKLADGLRKLSDPKLLIGVAVLAALAGTLAITGIALKQFGKTDFKSVLIGIGALTALAGVAFLLSKAGPSILIGAATLLVLSSAIFVAGKAFQQFADIDWKGVVLGGVSLAAFAAGAALVGSFAPAILLGSLAIGVLGIALIPFAKAMELFSKAAQGFANAISTIIDALAGGFATVLNALGNSFDAMVSSIERLSKVNGLSLLDTAAGLTALSGALLLFSAANLGGAVANLFSNILGGGPIKQIEKFAGMSQSLKVAADSIKELAEGIGGFDPNQIGTAGESLKNFISGFADGMFKKDPLKPLRELARAMKGISFSTENIGKFSSDIQGFTSTFTSFATATNAVAEAIMALNYALEDLSTDNLKKLSDLNLQDLNVTTSTVNVTKTQNSLVQPIRQSSQEMSGEMIYQGSVANQVAQEQRSESMMMAAIGAGGGGGGGSKQQQQQSSNSTTINYTSSNHIDETTQRAVFESRF